MQVVLLWLTGVFVSFESSPGNISSFLFLAAGLGLSIEYDLPRFSRLSIAGVLGIVYLVTSATSFAIKVPLTALGIVMTGHIMFGAGIGFLLLYLWKQRVNRYRSHTDSLIDLVSERTNELETLLQERTELIKEIHHRVKNNMQLTSSLLRLTMNDALDPHALHVLTRIRGRVDVMGLVHHRIYKAGRLSRVALKPYLADIVVLIDLPGYTRPELQVNLAEDYLIDLDTAVPFGLVVHDLIVETTQRANDAARTGFRPRPLRILLELRAETLVFRMEEHTLKQLAPPLDPEKSLKTELQIIYGLCDQLSTRLSMQAIDDATAEETRISYEIPIHTVRSSGAA
ncbi:MAG: sensor histidine kinase [Spirochaetaceae bacterium]|nr:MAG: sensor histidine kinase [Spirochaetaceae bacterium]